MPEITSIIILTQAHTPHTYAEREIEVMEGKEYMGWWYCDDTEGVGWVIGCNHSFLFLIANVGGLGQAHVQDVIVEQQFISRFRQNLRNLLSVFDFPHIEIGCIGTNIQGLFLEA